MPITAFRTGFIASLAAAATLLAPVSAAGQRSPILERERETDWTLRVSVSVRAEGVRDGRGMPVREPLTVQSAAIVFPMLYDSASHAAWPTEGGRHRDTTVRGELKIDGRVVDEQPQYLTGYHSGARLGRWQLHNWQGEAFTLDINYPVTSYNTKFDEDAASRLDWPESWPTEAQSTFQPQEFIDVGPQGERYDMAPVEQLVKQWTEGKDPKTVKPVVLAKFFAGEVWRHVQPSGNGLNFNRSGQLEGIDLQGAPETARRGQGTEFDMVCLLAAVYRQAGLPARTVIGFDAGAGRQSSPVTGRGGRASLRAWVEFALVDGQGNLVWVPVDVVRMRRSSSRPPRLESNWRWFGTHNELNGVVPFAFQFHPPATGTVAHGSPGFWGWLVSPKPPERAQQSLRFDAIRTPRRPSDPRPVPGEQGR